MVAPHGRPEAVKIETPRLHSFWFASCIRTYIERDIRDLGEIRNLSNFIKLVNILASRSANILNIKALASSAGLNEVITSNYLTMLELVFQVKRVPAFSANFSKRFIKSPKLYFLDTGILCHLLGITEKQQFLQSPYKGAIVETYVLSELYKHAAISTQRTSIYHYRTNDGKEIDFIIETPQGLTAIEVKATGKVDARAFRHIRYLKKKSSRLKKGIVFYLGDQALPFGEDLYAVPLGFI